MSAKIVSRQRARPAQTRRLDADQPQQGVGKISRHVFFLLLSLATSDAVECGFIPHVHRVVDFKSLLLLATMDFKYREVVA